MLKIREDTYVNLAQVKCITFPSDIPQLGPEDLVSTKIHYTDGTEAFVMLTLREHTALLNRLDGQRVGL